LMFAKISPDGNKAAYVSEQNVYVEDLKTSTIKALTTDGNRRMINGTLIGSMKRSSLAEMDSGGALTARELLFGRSMLMEPKIS